MTRLTRFLAPVAILAVLGTGLILAGASRAQVQRSRAEFMRVKLDFSKRILEGLTVENYDAITKSARSLKMLSQAAEWEVPTIPHVEDYLAYTTEFQRICDELGAKARDRNIDGATLAYVKLTMSCVNCHKYVRASK